MEFAFFGIFTLNFCGFEENTFNEIKEIGELEVIEIENFMIPIEEEIKNIVNIN